MSRRLSLLLAATASLLLMAAPGSLVVRAAATGVITGHVELRRPPVAPGRRPGVSDLGSPPVQPTADPQMSVVYLETAPRGAFEQNDTGHAVMDQRNETFVPHVLAITTGTTVDFPNSDRIYHNVFSLSKPHPFDLGRYAVGRSKSIRFDRPGIIRVFCDIHSHMSAFILVFSHPFFSVTDGSGHYRIENVPSGNYTLVAWNEGVASESRPVAVTDGATTEADFTLR